MATPFQRNKTKQLRKNKLQRQPQARTSREPGSAVSPPELQAALDNPQAARPETILRLQRLAGNRAMQGLLQRKLTVDPAGDQSVQRQEEEEEIQTKSSLQRSSEDGFEIGHEIEASLAVSRDGGSPSPAEPRAFMESRFGADLPGVRIHTGDEATQLNRVVQTQAFTDGNDTYFNEGKYDPQTEVGKQLLADELTHTIQQGGSGTQPALQRAMEDAYVTDTAQLHQIVSDQDKGTISGGPKLKTGDEIQADETVKTSDGQWMQAQAAGKSGYIRASKVVLKRTITGPNVGGINSESNTVEQGQELSDKWGGGFDTLAGGMEQAFIKGNVEGRLQDLNQNEQSHQGDKTRLDVVSGVGDTAMGIFGMIANAKQISSQKTAWENMAAGYGFVESMSKGVSGSTKIVDAIAKAHGSKDGVGKSDVAGKITGAIADGLSAVKNAALGIIGLYRLFKSQSDQKGKDALVTFKTLTEAAASAAKVAKNAFDIIGNGIPMSLIYTIPALGIAVSAINLLIRLWDAIKAGNVKGEMMQGADALRQKIAANLGEVLPTEENVDTSKLFDKDRRGTFPNYKTYFRVKQPVRTAIKNASTNANTQWPLLNTAPKDAYDDVKNNVTTKPVPSEVKDKITSLIGPQAPADADQFNTDTLKPLDDILKDAKEVKSRNGVAHTNEIYARLYNSLGPQALRLYDSQKKLWGVKEAVIIALEEIYNAANLALGDKLANARQEVGVKLDPLEDPVKGKAREQANLPGTPPPTATSVEFDKFKTGTKNLRNLDQTVDEYEFVDKMSEINQKRQTSGWTDVVLELVSMAGDITTIAVGATGIGAAIGQGVKAASAGYKLAHGGAKFVQKLYRDRGQGQDKKSSLTKHKEYVQHAHFIYQQLADFSPASPPTTADQKKAKDLEGYIRATGVNYGMWIVLKWNPQSQVEMLVEAMKQR